MWKQAGRRLSGDLDLEGPARIGAAVTGSRVSGHLILSARPVVSGHKAQDRIEASQLESAEQWEIATRMPRADIDEDEVPRVRPGARVERLALGVAQRARVVIGDRDPPCDARSNAYTPSPRPAAAEIFLELDPSPAAVVGVLSLAWVASRKDSLPAKRRRLALSQARCMAIRRNSSYSAGCVGQFRMNRANVPLRSALRCRQPRDASPCQWANPGRWGTRTSRPPGGQHPFNELLPWMGTMLKWDLRGADAHAQPDVADRLRGSPRSSGSRTSPRYLTSP